MNKAIVLMPIVSLTVAQKRVRRVMILISPLVRKGNFLSLSTEDFPQSLVGRDSKRILGIQDVIVRLDYMLFVIVSFCTSKCLPVFNRLTFKPVSNNGSGGMFVLKYLTDFIICEIDVLENTCQHA